MGLNLSNRQIAKDYVAAGHKGHPEEVKKRIVKAEEDGIICGAERKTTEVRDD